MRILCFGRFYDDVPGGMQRHIEHLFQSLKGSVEFVHLVPSRDRSAANFLLHNFPVVRKPSLNLDGSLAVSPSLITEARRLHKQHNFDLIHLHFPDPMSHLASTILPRHIPRIISWHADIVRQQKLLTLYRPLLQHAVQSAAAIIVATENHVDCSPELSRLHDKSRVHVIPYGFQLDRFLHPAEAADALRTRFPGKRIFALGRHVYYKGFEVLIRAMRHVHTDAQLLIGGTGPLTAQLKELANTYEVAERVHFIGLINEQELPAYYQAADVFCLPAISPAEAFGIVQVEAMASALPVISTDLPSGISVVNKHGETGLLVQPNNVNALAAAINSILADEQMRKIFGRQAREHAIKNFSLTAMGQHTLNIYRNCMPIKSRAQAMGEPFKHKDGAVK